MGNYLSPFTDKKQKSQEETLDFIVKHTIKKLVKKLIYKPSMVKVKDKYQMDYRFMDMRKLKNYQYKQYLIPVDPQKNQYIVLDKKEYYRLLFRLVYSNIPRISIYNGVFDLYTKRIETFTSLNKTVYKTNKTILDKFCNIFIRVNIKHDGSFNYGIVVPFHIKDELFNEFKSYFISIFNDSLLFDNLFYRLIVNYELHSSHYPSSIQKETNPEYFQEMYIKCEDKDDPVLKFMLFTFITFLLKKCSNNYIVANLKFVYIDIDQTTLKEKDHAHANNIFIQKLYKHDILDSFIFYQYEPHGYKSGYTFIKGIDKVFTDMTNVTLLAQHDKIFKKYVIPITFQTKHATCEIGPQSVSRNQDIGYCGVISCFWFNCFINILENINMHDNYHKSRFDLLNYFKHFLSNIPIETWVNKIDEEIASISETFTVEYPKTKYNIMSVIDTMKYYIVNDYDDNNDYFSNLLSSNKVEYQKYLLDNKNTFYFTSNSFLKSFKLYPDLYFKNKYPSSDLYFQLIKHKILNKYHFTNPKISVEDFFDLYNQVLTDMNIDLSVIQNIASKKHKLRDVGYYNIFVEFAYSMFSLFYSSDFFTPEEKKTLNESLKKDKIVRETIEKQYDIFKKRYDIDDDDEAQSNEDYIFNEDDENDENEEDEEESDEEDEEESDEEDDKDYLDMIMKETKEYEEAEEQGKDLTQTSLGKRFRDDDDLFNILGQGNSDKGKNEYSQMMLEQEEESVSFNPPKIKCKTNKYCKKINENYSCDTKQNICVNIKETIGTRCNDNRDCFSGNCKSYQYQTEVNGKPVNKELKLCRK